MGLAEVSDGVGEDIAALVASGICERLLSERDAARSCTLDFVPLARP